MTQAGEANSDRVGEVWRRLAEVYDPELDEPVTEMGFVEAVAVADDGRVDVDFRLPTYWCSPNFAFLMLNGVRAALDELPWRGAYVIRLHDHLCAEELNAGVAAGKTFSQIFGEMTADLDLAPLREKFRVKAFKRRQEAVIVALRAAGLGDEGIVGMSVAALREMVPPVDGFALARARYLAALRDAEQDQSDAPAFVGAEGEVLDAADLARHLAELRAVRINMEFSGALCRGLKQARYKELGEVDGEPTLVDFIPGRPGCERRAPRLDAS